MNNNELRQIYVAVLDRGNDAWQRVDAISEGGDIYRIASVNSEPEERWEYVTDDLVRCRTMILPDGERVLVATQRVDTAP